MCIPFIAAGAAVLGTTLSASAATAINVGLTTSLVAGLAASGVQVAGQLQAASAAKEQGKYEAKLARYEAVAARQSGEVEAFKHGIESRREWGRFMLQNAASNRDLSFGTAAQQAIEVRKFQTFDSQIIARNVEARVTGLNISAANARIRGQNQATGLTLGAVGTGISGATSFVSTGFGFLNIGNSSLSNATRFYGSGVSGYGW